jgi:3-methylfumaryl-CoA hydratase
VTLPDIGLPRLLLGGRKVDFTGDIVIGARLRRESRQGEVQVKQGRSGRFALVTVSHSIFAEGTDAPVLVEVNDYVLREATRASDGQAAAPRAPVPSASDTPPAPAATRSITPDERLLFRYSAITDNPHRIHYDLPYAQQAEGYPALLVNGSIPAMFLLELFRDVAGTEPSHFSSRNVAPIFCGQTLTLSVQQASDGWRLWAENSSGRVTFEAHAA